MLKTSTKTVRARLFNLWGKQKTHMFSNGNVLFYFILKMLSVSTEPHISTQPQLCISFTQLSHHMVLYPVSSYSLTQLFTQLPYRATAVSHNSLSHSLTHTYFPTSFTSSPPPHSFTHPLPPSSRTCLQLSLSTHTLHSHSVQLLLNSTQPPLCTTAAALLTVKLWTTICHSLGV